jgi:uncharacterized RDD family membrane protein YckC
MDLLAELTLEPKLAPIKYRISAAIIDFLILWLISFLMGYLFGDYYVYDDSLGYHISGFPAFFLFVIDFGLISIQEGVTGKTIGKRIVKIKVVKENYSNSSIASSVVRHLFDVIDIIFLVGIFVAAAGQKKQRIGDLVARTIVVID